MSGVIRAQLNAGYSFRKEVTQEDYEGLRTVFTTLPEEKEDYWNDDDHDAIIDVDEIEKIPENILSVIIFKPIKKLYFSELEQKIPNLNSVNKETVKEIINNTYQIHLPNNELITFKKLDYMEDCCTDALQKKLDEGWSILAICPQAGNRRPDYIVGKK